MKLDREVRRHLEGALGIRAVLIEWQAAKLLPFFLQDHYEFREADILGRRVVLVIDGRGKMAPGRDLRVHLKNIADSADLPVVYVVQAVSSHERRWLVEQKIAFIVPGNQLYLPTLGIDFRERYRQRRKPEDRPLSPATQAILIAAMMRGLWGTEWPAGRIAAELGYGAMTASRAAKELTTAGIATLAVRDRQHLLRLDEVPARVWGEAERVLSSPAKRLAWVLPEEAIGALDPMPAGESALARHSMIGEPARTTFAVSAEAWRKGGSKLETVTEGLPGGIEIQIWSYGPRLGTGAVDAVDPVSLWLSLRGSKDERVQLALDELKAEFPWSRA